MDSATASETDLLREEWLPGREGWKEGYHLRNLSLITQNDVGSAMLPAVILCHEFDNWSSWFFRLSDMLALESDFFNSPPKKTVRFGGTVTEVLLKYKKVRGGGV